MESGHSRGALRGIAAGLRRGRLVLALGALALIGSATMAAPSAFANTPPTCADLGPYSGSAGEAIPLAADCSDADGPSALTYSLVNYPSAGSLVGDPNTGASTYTSYLGFSGTDTFTYRAFDGVDYSNTATVTVNITGPSTTNQLPSCPDSTAFVQSGGSVDLSGNCTDLENDPISYGCCNPNVTGGTLQFLSATSVRYTPNPGTTDDSFGYSATDNVHPFSSVSTTVHIKVTSPGAGTFDSAPDATPTDPYVASLTTTQPGPVTIDTRAVTATPPTGFFLLNQEFDITAPPALERMGPDTPAAAGLHHRRLQRARRPGHRLPGRRSRSPIAPTRAASRILTRASRERSPTRTETSRSPRSARTPASGGSASRAWSPTTSAASSHRSTTRPC